MDVLAETPGERGQTSPLGVGLVFAIVVIGTVSIVVLGGAALSSTEHSAEVSQAEHTMSQFDSMAAQVALGDSPVQSLRVGQADGGTYRTDPDAGRIEIVHANYSGNGNDEVIYEGTMGAVVYENGDDEIAYQGGGVWKQSGSGESRMISPPELHYRDATLTFPVIRVNPGGSGDGASGGQTLSIRRQSAVNEVYPNRATTYPDGTTSYANPQSNGTISVRVESEYYEAWAEYFRERTSGEVRSFDSNETVLVELVSLGTGEGDFAMPPEGSPIEVRGLKPQGHALDSFEIELVPDEDDSADFNNLQWSLQAEQGDQEFEVFMTKGQDGGCDSMTVDVSMYYSDDDGDSYHGWKGEDAFTTECNAENNPVVVVDFANLTSDMNYTDLKQGDMNHYSPQQSTREDQATIDEHDSVSWEGTTYSEDDTEETGRLFKHYMAQLGPDFDLVVRDKQNDGVSESSSSGSMTYEGTGQFVTFLHVSENEIDVEFE